MLPGMAIKTRLNRLELRLSTPHQQWSFDEEMANAQALSRWLDDQGFADCLAAIEARVRPPLRLEGFLADQAQHDPRRRAWRRVEAALDEGGLPAEADVVLVSGAS